MNKKTISGASSITPPTNTLENDFILDYKGEINDLGQFILIDWFEATIKFESLVDNDRFGLYFDYRKVAQNLFQKFFKLNSDVLIYEKFGFNGYNESLYYEDIYISYNQTRPDMGMHIKMSGQGCRNFEKLGLCYYEFIKQLKSYEYNISRIDISIDDFSGKYFDINTIKEYVNKNSVSSKYRSSMLIEKTSLSDSSTLGQQIQFGSKASRISVVFYDKLKERTCNSYNVSEFVSHWIRTEVRFRHEYAKDIVEKIFENGLTEINRIIKSTLFTFIKFKNLNSKDSNISRRADAKWWTDFLENVDELKLTNYMPEPSITRKRKWLEDSVSRSILQVHFSELNHFQLDNISLSYLIGLFKTGLDKFDYKTLESVNQCRIANGLIPITYQEVKDYVHDIHEFILLDNRKEA